jgi:hypothetical protein
MTCIDMQTGNASKNPCLVTHSEVVYNNSVFLKAREYYELEIVHASNLTVSATSGGTEDSFDDQYFLIFQGFRRRIPDRDTLKYILEKSSHIQLREYPLESINDIASDVDLPAVTARDIGFAEIGIKFPTLL